MSRSILTVGPLPGLVTDRRRTGASMDIGTSVSMPIVQGFSGNMLGWNVARVKSMNAWNSYAYWNTATAFMLISLARNPASASTRLRTWKRREGLSTDDFLKDY